MGKIFITAGLFITTWLTCAWDLMLTVGSAHHSWWHVIPPMSWGEACGITSPLLIVLAVATVITVVTGD